MNDFLPIWENKIKFNNHKNLPNSSRCLVVGTYSYTLSEMKTFKFYMGVKLKMVRQDDETTPYMRTNPHFVSSFEDVMFAVNSRQEQDVDNTVVGSGFTITKIIFLDIHILKSDPLQASPYIDLPKKINLKKAVVNIQNKDNKCFLWSVLAHFLWSGL